MEKQYEKNYNCIMKKASNGKFIIPTYVVARKCGLSFPTAKKWREKHSLISGSSCSKIERFLNSDFDCKTLLRR